MKEMKKDAVMTVGSFSKKDSRDLKKILKITLEGILYLRGVRVEKFQLVSEKIQLVSNVESILKDIFFKNYG